MSGPGRGGPSGGLASPRFDPADASAYVRDENGGGLLRVVKGGLVEPSVEELRTLARSDAGRARIIADGNRRDFAVLGWPSDLARYDDGLRAWWAALRSSLTFRELGHVEQALQRYITDHYAGPDI